MKSEGEDEDRHQPEPERRHRVAEEGEQHARPVEQRVLLGRRNDPRRQPDRQRDDGRGGSQQQRVAESLQHERQDLGPLLQGVLEVAVQHPPEPPQILEVDRLVQTERLPQVGDVFWSRVQSEQRLGDVAGNQLHQEENDDGDPEQNRDQQEQPAKDVGRHRRALPSRSRTTNGEWSPIDAGACHAGIDRAGNSILGPTGSNCRARRSRGGPPSRRSPPGCRRS